MVVVLAAWAWAWAESSRMRLWSFAGEAMVRACPSGRVEEEVGAVVGYDVRSSSSLTKHDSREARGTKTAGMQQVTARPGCGERCFGLEGLRSWTLLVSKRTSKLPPPPQPPFSTHERGTVACIRISVGHGVVGNIETLLLLLVYTYDRLSVLSTRVSTIHLCHDMVQGNRYLERNIYMYVGRPE